MRRWQNQRGFAFLQVMMVIALASVLGFSLLADTSLRLQTSRNFTLAAQADALAESGVQTAMYYLLNPWKAGVSSGSYWTGGTDMPVRDAGGTVTVSVTRDALNADEYLVVSTGKQRDGGGAAVTRTLRVRVNVRPGQKISHAITSGSALLVGPYTDVSGSVRVNDKLTSYGRISGTASAHSFSILGGWVGSLLTLPATDRITTPTISTIETYPTYVYSDGRSYSRTVLASNAIGNGVSPTLGPTASNPAGIYYYNGNFTLNSNVKIDGTLIVTGNLLVNGSSVRITGQPGYPALIVLGEMRTRAYKSLVVDGLTFVGKSIKSDGGTSFSTTLNFNGGLMFGEAASIDAAAAAQVRVTYNPANLTLPDLDTSQPRSVSIVSWKR